MSVSGGSSSGGHGRWKPACCAPGTRILLIEYPGLAYQVEQAFAGLPLDVNSGLPPGRSIHEYRLIIFSREWMTNFQGLNNVWWQWILGGEWSGRVIINTEYRVGQPRSVDEFNMLSDITGITATMERIDVAAGVTGFTDPDPLTENVPVIMYAGATGLIGGTSLSRTATGGTAWLAHNYSPTLPGPVDFVIAGDTDWLNTEHILITGTIPHPYYDAYPLDAGYIGVTGQFLRNCYTVPI